METPIPPFGGALLYMIEPELADWLEVYDAWLVEEEPKGDWVEDDDWDTSVEN